MKTEAELVERLRDLHSTMEVTLTELVSEPANEEIKERMIDLLATFDAIAWVLGVEDRFASNVARVRNGFLIIASRAKEDVKHVG